MNPSFGRLSRQRQDQILNGAMAVFGRHEYAKAGTDEICREAGISKGLLYHYFQTKKGLYLALYQRAVETVLEALERELEKGETDFFEILNQSLRSKLALLKRHPPLFDFLMRAYNEESPEVLPDLKQLTRRLQSAGAASLFQNLDAGKFRDGLDLPKLLELMGWVSEGFMKKRAHIEREPVEQIVSEFNGYMDIFRKAFYKEEHWA